MNLLRLIAIGLSLLVHASIGFAMLPSLQKARSEALDLGKGTDIVLVQQGIATEGLSLGDDAETIDTAAIMPAEAAPPPPPQEVKPDELHDVIASEASEVEQDVVKTEQPPPLKPAEQEVAKLEEPPPLVPEPPKPDVVQMKTQPPQVAVTTQQSSGEEQTGGDAKAFGLYLGQINERVQRAKVNPRSRVAGVVVMRFTIGTDGHLLSKEVAKSSGSKVLDEAATEALDRAAPFPPIPPEVSIKPLAFTQPFKFITR
jgi:protein TonB